MKLNLGSPLNRIVSITTIDIQELSPDAAEAVKSALARGEEVFITEKEKKRFAKVVSVYDDSDLSPQSGRERGLFGSMKGLVTYMADDFNEPLDDFEGYMPEQLPEK